MNPKSELAQSWVEFKVYFFGSQIIFRGFNFGLFSVSHFPPVSFFNFGQVKTSISLKTREHSSHSLFVMILFPILSLSTIRLYPFPARFAEKRWFFSLVPFFSNPDAAGTASATASRRCVAAGGFWSAAVFRHKFYICPKRANFPSLSVLDWYRLLGVSVQLLWCMFHGLKWSKH